MTPRRTLLAVVVLAFAFLAAGLVTVPTANAAKPADCATAKALTWEYATCEAQNVANTGQNFAAHLDLGAGIVQATIAYQERRAKALAADPERQPNPNSCTLVVLCIVDPRLEGWTDRGGLVSPVLYTSRSGATISGHVWATRAGPAKRPAIVVTNGSIIGYEEGYWFLAQTLAKAGFVVLTFDAQGEGMSDQLGEAPDQLEDAFAGIPALGLLGPRAFKVDFLGGNGLPFYDGTQDALDFLLSTPAERYKPRPSTSTGTSHDGKQVRRVAAGLDAGYNPLWQLVDPGRVGLTGQSYGAQAASWLAQKDPRVKAAVALDTLCIPVAPSPDEAASLTAPAPDFGGLPHITYGFNKTCFSTPAGPAPQITKPILGIAGDYLLAPVPYLLPPNPLGKSRASLDYSAAGVDTGQILIRGGTHLSTADLPIVLPGSERAVDLVAWYTTAWFAKYLQPGTRGDDMLRTTRWQTDARTGEIDPSGDANLLSWHFRSRLDIGRSVGDRFACEDLRKGCPGQTAPGSDGWTGTYSLVTATR